MMERIRKGDEVIVIAGRSRGQRGHVLKVLGDNRFLVENVNMIKKHQKPDPQNQRPGGIIEREAPIQASNVMLYNPATDKGDRVGFKFLEDGRKVRFFRSTGEVVDI
jgi:large subunit ribosomal protein L24